MSRSNRGDRALLAVGNHLDPRLVDTLREQEVTGRRSAALTKSKVVFTGTTLVTVTFDGDGRAGLAFRPA